MLSPTSRLSDDLYALYLAALAWLILPAYGEALTVVLPSQWDEFDTAFTTAVCLAGVIGVWSGLRGGPLMVSRAAILHELGSPVSRRTLLLPRLLRQATAWAVVAAVLSTVALVLADSAAFDYGPAIAVSIAGGLATASAVFHASVWMVARHGDGPSAILGFGSTALVSGLAAVAASGNHATSGVGVLTIFVFFLLSLGLAAFALRFAPVQPLWKRAWAVESMRSSMQSFDFQRVFLDLRNATEQPAVASGVRLAPRRLPLALWRHLAAMQHVLAWHLIRLCAISASLAVLLWWGDPSQGIVTLAIAAAALLLGLELAGAVAATADQMTFLVHYPKGSGSVLRAQVTCTVVMAAAFGLAVVAGKLNGSPRLAAGVLLVVIIGALGAAVQARLGSPDLVAAIDRFGVQFVGGILWARALSGPLLVLGVTVAVFHQFLRPEPLHQSLDIAGSLMVAAAFLTATSPLERAIR